MNYARIILADCWHVGLIVTGMVIGLELLKPGLATNFLSIPGLLLVTTGLGLGLIFTERYR